MFTILDLFSIFDVPIFTLSTLVRRRIKENEKPSHQETTTAADITATDGYGSECQLEIVPILEVKEEVIVASKVPGLNSEKQSFKVYQRKSHENLSSAAVYVSGDKPTYLDFPFVENECTIKHIRKSHVLFIMRGLPGSGKSTIVNTLKSLYDSEAVICSADDFFYNEDGEYMFNEKLLSQAHSSCQQKAKEACCDRRHVVIIDNTNVKKWEMKCYIHQANMSGYVVVLVEPKTPWKWNVQELFNRNSHGLPLEVLKKKVNSFDDVYPSYYGWFIEKQLSERLSSFCSRLFMQCLEIFPEMMKDFLQVLHIKVDSCSNETALGILEEYFRVNARSSPLLHCTSKFCARGKAPRASMYHQRADVKVSCGQCFCMSLTAIVITKRTLSLRVKLGGNMVDMNDRPEENDWGRGQRGIYSNTSVLSAGDVSHSNTSVSSESCLSQRNTTVLSARDVSLNISDDDSNDWAEVKGKKKMSKVEKKEMRRAKKEAKSTKRASKNKVKSMDDIDSVDEDEEESFVEEMDFKKQSLMEEKEKHVAVMALSDGSANFDDKTKLVDIFPHIQSSGKGRGGHCTVKTAQGVESKETNFDVLQLCDIEMASDHNESDFTPVKHGRARYYGDGFCCVYFNKPLKVNALFSGYY